MGSPFPSSMYGMISLRLTEMEAYKGSSYVNIGTSFQVLNNSEPTNLFSEKRLCELIFLVQIFS